MSSAVIGALRVNLGMDSAQFNRGASDAESRLKGLERQLGNAAKAAAAIGAAAVAAGAALAVNLTMRSMEAIDAQSKLAARVGGSITAIQTLERAATEAGMAKGTLSRAAEILNQRLGEVQRTGAGPAADALRRLRLEAADLANMDVDQRFAAIADRMRELNYSTDQQADTLRQLGIRQGEVINLMLAGSDAINSARADVEAFGVAVSDIDAATIERANDAMSRLSMFMEGIGNQMAVRLGPLIEHIAEWLGNSAREADGFGDAMDHAISLGLRLFAALQREVYHFRVELDQAIAQVLNLFDTVAGAPPALLGWITGSSAEDWGFKPINESFGNLKDELEKPPSGEEWEEWYRDLREQAAETSRQMLAERAKLQGGNWETEDPEGGRSRGGGRRGGGSSRDREQEMLDRQLEQLRNALATAEEQELASYERRMEQLREFRDRQMVTQEEFNDLEQRAQQQHADRMIEIQRQQAQEEARIRQMSMAAVSSTLGSISQAINSFGEKNLAAAKGFAIAQALINTYEGITKALTLPFPLNWAQAAAVAASGFAQVASISQTSRNSSGGGSAAAAAPQAAAPPAQQQTLYIEGLNQNSLYSGEAVRRMAEELVEYQRNGGRVVFAQT